MQPIYIQLFFIALCFIEALHDRVVIDLQNYQNGSYQALSKDWHTFSAIYYSMIVVLVAYLSGWYWIAIPLFLIRATWFALFINLLRDKPMFYLSNTGFDKTMKDILGNDAGAFIFVGGNIAIISVNLYL